MTAQCSHNDHKKKTYGRLDVFLPISSTVLLSMLLCEVRRSITDSKGVAKNSNIITGVKIFDTFCFCLTFSV